MSRDGEDAELDRVRELAQYVRSRIESSDRSQLPDDFITFPQGACDYSSRLLKRHFEVNGEEGFEVFCGPTGNEHEMHAWLQRGDLIVDITLDQFANCQEPVFVTRNSSWHARLGPIPLPVPNSAELMKTYHKVFPDD